MHPIILRFGFARPSAVWKVFPRGMVHCDGRQFGSSSSLHTYLIKRRSPEFALLPAFCLNTFSPWTGCSLVGSVSYFVADPLHGFVCAHQSIKKYLTLYSQCTAEVYYVSLQPRVDAFHDFFTMSRQCLYTCLTLRCLAYSTIVAFFSTEIQSFSSLMS